MASRFLPRLRGKRLGLTSEQKQLIQAQLQKKFNAQKVEEAMYFLLGQDYKSPAAQRQHARTWVRSGRKSYGTAHVVGPGSGYAVAQVLRPLTKQAASFPSQPKRCRGYKSPSQGKALARAKATTCLKCSQPCSAPCLLPPLLAGSCDSAMADGLCSP